MISRLFLVLCLPILLVSCKKTSQTTEAPNPVAKEKLKFSDSDLKQLDYTEFSLDQNVKSRIESWVGYFTLASVIEDIKTPDFSFFKENDAAIVNLINEINEGIPKEFDTQAIQSRITVVEIMLYKAKETIDIQGTNKSELLKAVKQLSEAFSNLNFQLNKKLEKDKQKIERPI
jgi:hypothetical protein